MTALIVKAMTFTRRVSTPRASAASSFSRIARMARPRTVSRSHQTRPADQQQDRQREPGVSLRGVEGNKEGRSLDVADPVRAAGHRDPVGGDEGIDDLEADRHHRQVVASQLPRRAAEHRACQGGGNQAEEQGEPPVHVPAGRAEGDRVRADPVEGGLGQRDLSGVAQDHDEAERRDAPGGAQDEQVRGVSAREDQRQEHNHDGAQGQCQVSGFEQAGGSLFGVFAAHAFSATFSPKIPCGRNRRNRKSTRKLKPSL